MSIKTSGATEAAISCPFCGEPDYDRKGLKLHLLYLCEEYKKVEGK